MKIFKHWKERRRQRRQLRELSDFANVFRTMDQMAEAGLLAWNQKNRQLFIDSSLAVIMMRNVDSWTNFINNVYLWQYSKLCEQAWNDFFLREELKAVREYKKAHRRKVLTRQDVQRIRDARRAEIAQSDMPAPKIESFEFFIVAPPKDTKGSDPSVSSPVGELTAVGHYDPETDKMEMALWSEIAPLLNK